MNILKEADKIINERSEDLQGAKTDISLLTKPGSQQKITRE